MIAAISHMPCRLYLCFRLPIIQGGTFSFFVPTFAILSLEKFKCPDSFDSDMNKWTVNMTYEDKTEEWQIRMREIQGAICVASLFQVVIGFSGMLPTIIIGRKNKHVAKFNSSRPLNLLLQV